MRKIWFLFEREEEEDKEPEEDGNSVLLFRTIQTDRVKNPDGTCFPSTRDYILNIHFHR